MNDATLWNSGKTARQDRYSVPFIHIQGIFYSWRDFGVYLSVLYFPCHFDVIKAGSSASQKTIGSYSSWFMLFTRQRFFNEVYIGVYRQHSALYLRLVEHEL